MPGQALGAGTLGARFRGVPRAGHDPNRQSQGHDGERGAGLARRRGAAGDGREVTWLGPRVSVSRGRARRKAGAL